MSSAQRALPATLRRWLTSRGIRLERMSAEERTFLNAAVPPDTRIPACSAAALTAESPRLRELRERYAALNWPVNERSRWRQENLSSHLDLRHFRGETPITWHYRESLRVTRLKFLLYLNYIRGIDRLSLLDRLEEDGAFGCWTYRYPQTPLISRDLLESVAEIEFLDRQCGLLDGRVTRILDIGAGYGRLAHRILTAMPGLEEYCCVDAIPESTFLCEHYLDFRACLDRARVVPLDEVPALAQAARFDLAVNIHSFSECPLRAINWWLEQLAAMQIPYLLIVPNQPTELLSTEADRSKCDFLPGIEARGYRLIHREPTIRDAAIRDELGIHDHFHLFRLDS